MVLDKESLQAIAQIVDETLEQKLEQKLEEKLDRKLDEKLEQKLEEKLEQKLEEKLDQKLEEKLDRKLDEKLDQKLEGRLERILDQKFAENNTSLKEELRSEFNLSFARVEHSIAKLDSRLCRVENDVHDIKLDIENNIRSQIRLLAEVYVPAAHEFRQAATDIREMKSSIDVLNLTVSRHSKLLENRECINENPSDYSQKL